MPKYRELHAEGYAPWHAPSVGPLRPEVEHVVKLKAFNEKRSGGGDGELGGGIGGGGGGDGGGGDGRGGFGGGGLGLGGGLGGGTVTLNEEDVGSSAAQSFTLRAR